MIQESMQNGDGPSNGLLTTHGVNGHNTRFEM